MMTLREMMRLIKNRRDRSSVFLTLPLCCVFLHVFISFFLVYIYLFEDLCFQFIFIVIISLFFWYFSLYFFLLPLFAFILISNFFLLLWESIFLLRPLPFHSVVSSPLSQLFFFFKLVWCLTSHPPNSDTAVFYFCFLEQLLFALNEFPHRFSVRFKSDFPIAGKRQRHREREIEIVIVIEENSQSMLQQHKNCYRLVYTDVMKSPSLFVENIPCIHKIERESNGFPRWCEFSKTHSPSLSNAFDLSFDSLSFFFSSIVKCISQQIFPTVACHLFHSSRLLSHIRLFPLLPPFLTLWRVTPSNCTLNAENLLALC